VTETPAPQAPPGAPQAPPGAPQAPPGGPMTVLVWVAESTWQASVDAARRLVPADAAIRLLHVTPQQVSAAASGAYAGLLGRGQHGKDPGTRVAELAAASAADLLDAAARRLTRPCVKVERGGRVEREVVAAADGADLLVLARDGDRSRLGPRSLGPATRFVVDHAPCPVLLAWPEPAPPIGTIPPAPHGPPGPPGPPRRPRPHGRR
jgi:nucleotide-binding universal stress UspA family protein